MATISTARRVQYASGYLQLGLTEDARAELQQIAPEDRSAVEVVELWMLLHSEAKEWEQAALAAEQVTRTKPDDPQGWISWAYATRRHRDIATAEAILLAAEARLGPACGIVQYNLACYRCQLGDLDGARDRLRRACALEAYWRLAALEDADLEPLWPELGSAK